MTQRSSLFRRLLPAIIILVLGAGATYLVTRAQIAIVSVTGSAPIGEAPASLLALAVGDWGTENFATSAAPGEAFVAWRFNQPVALESVTQGLAGQVDSARAVRSMSVQYRNAEGGWTEAARAMWPDTDLAGPHSIPIAEPHAQHAATEWRAVALAGGTSPEIVMGWLTPERQRLNLLGRVLHRFKVDAMTFAVVVLAALALAVAYPNRAGPILFCGGCLASLIVANVVLLGLLHVPLLWTPDSSTYFQWPPFPVRMPGMNFLVLTIYDLVGFDGLHVVQLNLLLLSYFAGLACLVAATKRYWPFVPLTAFPIVWGALAVHASFMMTEAFFMSGLVLGTAGMMALAFGGGRLSAALAGFGLLLAVMVKAVGAALILPAVLAYRFVPGSHPRRLQLIAIAALPGIVGYLAMSAYGLKVNGRFAPQIGGGYSLIGHVAFLLEADEVPPAYRDVALKAVADLRARYAAMPPPTDPTGYVDFTANAYNGGLYIDLLPSFARRIGEITPPTDPGGRSFYASMNDFFTAWAVAAILRNPIRYALHCSLHYWALWRDSLSGFASLGDIRDSLLRQAVRQVGPGLIPPPEFIAYNKRWQQQNEHNILPALQYRLLSVAAPPFEGKLTFGLLVAALALSGLYLVPLTYLPPVAALIIGALLVNAYLAGTALFQVSLPRYAEMIVPVLPLAGAIALLGLVEWLAARKRGNADNQSFTKDEPKSLRSYS